jgi:Rhodopirellula transposase DDE domain
MSESGGASRGVSANGVDSGADAWRLESAHGRRSSDPRAVSRGWSRARRLFVAAETRTGRYGGIAAPSRATGVARSTTGRGLKDLNDPASLFAMQAAGKPVISIDTKKKEPIGPCTNVGSDYRPKGRPEQVKVHDFVDAELGKVVPYGVHDTAANAGCVSLGIDNAIRRNSRSTRSAAGCT